MYPTRTPRRRALAGILTLTLVATLAAIATEVVPAGADGNETPRNAAPFRSISAGPSHTCAVSTTATLRCWGANADGQLGRGDTTTRGDGAGEMGNALPAIDVGTGRTVRAVTTGFSHTCALLDNRTVKCWGANFLGQLGVGDTASRGDTPGEMGDALPAVDLGTGRTALALAAGAFHTCAVLDNGTVKCWGGNGGRLGLGDAAPRGTSPGQMGDALAAVDLGTGRTALTISAGQFQTCALLDNFTVKCWGFNTDGQLGLGDTNTRGDGPVEMGNALPAVDLGAGRTAFAISAGLAHTCALLDNGTVKCWGLNSTGQAGVGDTVTRGDGPMEMGNALPAVSLGTGRTAFGISAGAAHTCALLDDDTVKCWGANGGRLGVGGSDNRGDGPMEMGDALPAISLGTGRTALAVTTGFDYSCALLDDSTVKCWGDNTAGQLGIGDTSQRGDTLGEMGDALPFADLPGTGVIPTLSVGVTVTADQTRVVAGEDIDYHVTVTNTGELPLSSVLITAPDVPACDGSVAFLAPAATSVVDCSHTTVEDDVPQMTNQVLVTTAQGAIALSRNRRTRVDEVAPSLSVALTADQASVIEGEDIDYHITVTNTGNVALTGLGVTDPAVPACEGGLPDLAVGAETTTDCTRATAPADAGPFPNTATVDSAETEPVASNTLVVAVRHVQPDAEIRRGAGAFIGDDVLNGTGIDQTRAGTVPNLGSATFTARIHNDGNTTDSFTLLGQATTSRYTVTYKDGATNITAAVVAGIYSVENLAAGATRDITILIKAKAGTPVGNSVSRTLTATSAASPTTLDTVKATVTRR